MTIDMPQASIYFDGDAQDKPLRRTTKVKKLGWFDRWFMRKSEKVWNAQREERESMHPANTRLDRMSSDIDNVGGTTFTVIPCDGGTLIVTRHMDPSNFEPRVKRYIVPDGGDLGQRLSEILTFEAIKR